MTTRLVYTVAEAAEMLHISRRSCRRCRSGGGNQVATFSVHLRCKALDPLNEITFPLAMLCRHLYPRRDGAPVLEGWPWRKNEAKCGEVPRGNEEQAGPRADQMMPKNNAP